MPHNVRSFALLAALGAALAGLAGQVLAANPGAGRTQSSDEFVARNGAAIDPETHPGRQVYETNCAMCHEGGVAKAPARVWLEMLAPDAILHALADGVMSQQSAHLSGQQKEQVAEYLTRTRLADYHPPAPPVQCTGKAAAFEGAPPALASWGHDTRRFFPAETGGLAAADLPALKLKWAFAFPNAVRARSQPVMGWNTLFTGSQDGTVYAFDLATGCTKWTFRAPAEVRTAIVADPATKRLYFGDVLGRAYALDAFTGKQLWRTKLDDHPNATITGAPTLAGGNLFVPISSLEVTSAANTAYACCTFRGAVAALDPETGAVRWKYYVIPEPAKVYKKTAAGTTVLGPSGAPVWTSPTYDAARGRIYIGTGENYSSPADGNSDAIIALDAATGKRVWQTQLTSGDAWNVGCMMGNEACPDEHGPDYDLSASPLLVPLGGGKDIIVAGQKSGVAFGIDPETGKIGWSQRLGHGGTQGGVHFGMAASGGTVFVPIVDMADTRDGRVYDKAQNGAGIHAIDAATGRILWRQHATASCEGCDPGVSAAATAIPGAVLAGHLDGWFRAYDEKDGHVLWSFDTKTPVTSITGSIAKGGSMSGPGAAVYGGYMVFSSGYGMYYHNPGNALYVFSK
jgi:polyvinyl alcohol dehydrogenase (cytochrome)